MSRRLYFKENKITRNWELQDETLKVCGYLCNKAVCNFGGKTWTAWYAPEISISDGPWKLYGLPGLILKATDDMQTHAFEATTIRNANRPIYISKNILQIKTVREVFLRRKNNYEKDPEKNLVMSEIKRVDILKGNIMLINGKRSHMKSKIRYYPLEFE